MTREQCDEFEIRRDMVRLRHLKNDPKLRKARRKRRLSILSALIGACVTVGVMLVLSKSFLIALHGPTSYTSMIVPETIQRDDGSLMHQAMMPDPVTAEIAAMLRPLLTQAGMRAAVAPASPVPPVQNEEPPDA